MSTPPGVKYALVKPDLYKTMMERLQNNFKVDVADRLLQPIEKSALVHSESAMKNIWNRDDLAADEKVRLYTEQMNKFKSFHDDLSRPKSLEVVMRRTDENTNEEKTHVTTVSNKKDDDDSSIITRDLVAHGNINNEREIVNALPKTIRKRAEQLLNYLKLQPHISWNGNGEFIYDGKALHGSNISDLLLDLLSNRQKLISPIFFSNMFSKSLAQANVPLEWVKNQKLLNVVKAYKMSDENDVADEFDTMLEEQNTAQSF